jgi:agmatinase
MKPAYCPKTGEPEPGGLVPREAIYIVREVVKALDPDHFGFDIVGIAPQYDASDTTPITATSRAGSPTGSSSR